MEDLVGRRQMTERPILYTSLPPRVKRPIGDCDAGLSYISECVDSWRKSGFDVVSLNNAQEIKELAGLNYNVEYQQISADRPSIGDFLNAIRSSGKAVAGITNADVFMANSCEWLRIVGAYAATGMIFVERINIDPKRLRPTGQSCHGFDVFIFRTEPLSRIDLNCEFLFGQPWWDYWFPLAYAAAGGRLMAIDGPVLFHLDHMQNWSQVQWVVNSLKTVKYFLECSGDLPDDVVAEVRSLCRIENISEAELGPFAHWCFARLRRMAELIHVVPRPGGTNLLPTLVRCFNDGETREIMGELNEAQGLILDLRQAGALRGELSVKIQSGSPPTNDRKERYSIEALQVVPARLYEEIRYFSTILNVKNVDDNERVARAVTEGVRILTSRKASLRHFLFLNIAWIRSKYLAMLAAVRRRMLRAERRDDRQLQLAREQGAKYLAAVEYMVNEVADAGGMQRAGDYIVAFVRKKVEANFVLADGNPGWVEPNCANCRIEIAVLDATDKRFIPELKIRARLSDESDRSVADFDLPFVWDPMFFHYGREISLPQAGRHDLHVVIDPPTFVRRDRNGGERYANRVEVTFRGFEAGLDQLPT